MGYAVYEDHWTRGRWAGYGVPAECDWPGCATRIDRGLAYKCEEHVRYEQPDDAEDIEHVDEGCSLYFCSDHLYRTAEHDPSWPGKPDTREWVVHMLADESWQQWRDENPNRVRAMQGSLDG